MSDTPPIIPPPPTPPAPPEPPTPPEPKFTQADLDALDAKARRQTESKTRQAVADELGIPLDQIKAMIEERNAANAAQMTEAEKLQEQARTAIAEAEQAKAAAQAESIRARLTSALLVGTDEAPGCNPARLEAALALGMSKASEAGEDDPVAAAVAHVRQILPEVFTGSSSTAPGTPTPPSPPAPGRPLSERTPVPPNGDVALSQYEAWKKGSGRAPKIHGS
jgi:DNA-binding transcriptional MerR regulator